MLLRRMRRRRRARAGSRAGSSAVRVGGGRIRARYRARAGARSAPRRRHRRPLDPEDRRQRLRLRDRRASSAIAIVEPRPALVPLTFAGADWAADSRRSRASPCRCAIETGGTQERMRFVEDLLFTHRGLSGPAVLQISSYWRAGESLAIDLAPGIDLSPARSARPSEPARKRRQRPGRHCCRAASPTPGSRDSGLRRAPDHRSCATATLAALADRLAPLAHRRPAGTEGYSKAEVTAGGVDTRELDSRSWRAGASPGLHFIGEVVDVTGWLGGYNFQWAWASARRLRPRHWRADCRSPARRAIIGPSFSKLRPSSK